MKKPGHFWVQINKATKEAQRAGIDAAMAKGDRYLGRKPSYTVSDVPTPPSG